MRRALAAWLPCAVALVAPVAAAGPNFETVFVSSGSLQIEAYLYRPPGDGPFPALIYNHGSRPGSEREERPFGHIAEAFVPAGYVVLVVERRGYGKSGGETFSREVGIDRGARFVNRLVAEADDVGASIDYLAKQPFVDKRRIAVMGWSLGGIVTVITASQRSDVRAAIDQAAGALTWKKSPELQAKLREAAGKAKVPLLTMIAENDATTEGARAIDGAVRENTPHRLIVYPPFLVAAPPGVAEGHLLFGAGGVGIWRGDALSWLARYAGP
jgi:dienelactone hydrolase